MDNVRYVRNFVENIPMATIQKTKPLITRITKAQYLPHEDEIIFRILLSHLNFIALHKHIWMHGYIAQRMPFVYTL